ncbi:hypothetical protein [Pseudomonas citronellolis]|uniref:hypothetical protein n=1 Tax=Pseudomonas citronellolis TaxID=53408 RepID=UPI0021BE76EB|nr:hypothetical protein [Pseudomonas citronellolis]UXJ53991.1 hypothetical protein N5P21_07220 [Pseudomonas citronellolis]
MISHIFAVLDAVICVLIVLAALEFLRAIDAMHSPMLALSFYCVALGAFGLLIKLIATHRSSPASVVLHLGVVLYAWLAIPRPCPAADHWAHELPRRRPGYRPAAGG